MIYGTTSASFSVIRTFHKLADVEPEFHVDELLTGSDTFENAIKFRHGVCYNSKVSHFESGQS